MLINLGHSFGDALEALKDGKFVARAGWNGKGMYLSLEPDFQLTYSRAPSKNVRILPLITLCWDAGQTQQPGWTPSQADMLTEDWMIVDSDYEEPEEAAAEPSISASGYDDLSGPDLEEGIDGRPAAPMTANDTYSGPVLKMRADRAKIAANMYTSYTMHHPTRKIESFALWGDLPLHERSAWINLVWIEENKLPVVVPSVAQDGPKTDPIGEKARELYYASTANDPQIHSNRFPNWEELSPVTKRGWRLKAADQLEDASTNNVA